AVHGGATGDVMNVDGVDTVIARMPRGGGDPATVEALAGETDQVRHAAVMLVQHGHRGGTGSKIECAVAPHVEPVGDAAEPVLVDHRGDVAVGHERDEPQLLGITGDHRAASA